MLRNVFAVFAGMAAWIVIMQGATAAFMAAMPGSFTADGYTESAGILLSFLVLSVLSSILAGYATAAVARGAMKPVWVLAAIQLALGIFFQTASWEHMPVWYHVPFLLLLVPGNAMGGWIRASRREPAVA